MSGDACAPSPTTTTTTTATTLAPTFPFDNSDQMFVVPIEASDNGDDQSEFEFDESDACASPVRSDLACPVECHGECRLFWLGGGARTAAAVGALTLLDNARVSTSQQLDVGGALALAGHARVRADARIRVDGALALVGAASLQSSGRESIECES